MSSQYADHYLSAAAAIVASFAAAAGVDGRVVSEALGGGSR